MIGHYAVIGNPIAHSRSPEIHAAFAASLGHPIDYRRIRADRFDPAVDAFQAAGGSGLNVTAPFKLDAHAYATVRSERVRQAGAANCLRFVEGRVEAENFDGVGLLRDIERNLATPLGGRRILILGAGGAARGVIGPLLAARPAALVIANRTAARAAELAAAFPGADASEPTGPFDLVVNATSASLNRETLDLPPVFARHTLAYDMTYGRPTAFLQAAAAFTDRLHDGVGMLVEQAAESYCWWRGVRPETAAVIAALAG